jgi:tyrosinase
MSRISRRSFVAGMATVSAGLCFRNYAFASPAARVRHEARTAEGKKMLKIYADAVNNMMNAIREGDPRNWIFQWYTHSVPPNGIAQNKADKINSTYPSPSPFKDLATAMWNTCQAHPGSESPVEDYFLPWHRMFVYYFEEIIRYAAKNDSFTLPYWNYSAGQDSAKIPDEFRSGVLSKPNRNTGVNTGSPIASDARLDPKPALKQPTYSPQGVQQGFNLALDSGVHGQVHVSVGNTTNMGVVPFAGGDPVFWMHHCNIDRLWASWNRNGGRNPDTSTWLDKEFTFADRDGKPAKKKNKEVDDIAKLGYSYDRLEPAPPNFQPEARIALRAVHNANFAEAPSHALALGRGPVRLELEHSATNKNRLLVDELKALGTERSLYLVLKDLQTNAQPGVLYDVYLDLPASGSTNEATDNYVGTINFFNADHTHTGAASQQFYSFDVTDLARKLQSKGGVPEKPSVTIAPAGEPAGQAKPVVGDVSLVEQ